MAAALAWLEADPDPQTRQELQDLVAAAGGDGPDAADARAELADRFSGPLAFGTAGLRAALGAGPFRMNRVVVRRTAAGLARFLLDTADGAYTPRAVVGFDARRNSDVFAAESAAIFTAAGIETFLMPSALPTPVLAYAVRALGCEAGVMVTASHNPANDNGYKVYLGGRAVDEGGRGAQIVAPYDAEIAARIDYGPALESIRLAAEGWTVLPDAIADDYTAAVTALADARLFPQRGLKIVLTPMHGVGGATMRAVFEQAGFTDVTMVAVQADPDPAFPTVAFPNPEEAGAIDLALETAADVDADLVIANDPDADRAALAAKDPGTGAWRMLRGDEVGALLGAHMAARFAGQDQLAPDNGAPGQSRVFANSIVSSRLLGKIAADAGVEHVETLTGFKWISRVPGLVYGYEEALGYCVAPHLVRDKDGMSAALLLAELAADVHASGRTVFDLLDELALRYGLHATDQLSVRVENLALIPAMMDRLREQPPSSFAGSPVTAHTDLSLGSEALPPTDGMLFLSQDQTRVIIRPSGTEPKLKCYLEVIRPVGSAAQLPAVRAAAADALQAIKAEIRAALGLAE
ncbi:phospho-sugar mutase [Arthrobacter sp. CAU 1506]|uniref:phospho-sugar mutase n=1 Tax=Arthrobacter sp. CAU 1506 TaxID=2560052 RepID=UPI0010AC5C60|nr:phospho-sugar mutase [Arthrobacter sp. CAU 1506]TJY72618.1 phospho-sugar mutase [Arthrobacter sp. CAU 1506]